MRCESGRVYYRIIIKSPTVITQEDHFNHSRCSNNICFYFAILTISPVGYNVTIQAGNDVGLSSPVSVELHGAKEMFVSTSEMNPISGKYH